MSTYAFQDLEIDCSDMMTDPTAFAERVYKVAEELKGVCKADTSTAALIRQYEDRKEEPQSHFRVLFDAIYKYADEAPIAELPALIEMARDQVRALETMFRDRVIYEVASESESITDKRVAQLSYGDLRKAFNKYIEMINMFKLVKEPLESIPPLPGNYGSQGNTSLRHYVFEWEGHQWRNPRALCAQLGIAPISHYDKMMEYLDQHPELGVEVKEVM